MSEVEDDGADAACPYCGTSENCDHLLLVVDTTFRTAEGGILMKAFNSRWSDLLERFQSDEEFEEREVFGELLDEVASLSDVVIDSNHEGAPGMSSTYSTFFSSSKRKAGAALKRFQA